MTVYLPMSTSQTIPPGWMMSDADRGKLFMRKWLPLVVEPTEAKRLAAMPSTLVREMFPDVWRLGPQGELWRNRKGKLVEVLDACLDKRLSINDMLQFQHAYHDIFWTERWNQNTLSGFMNRYRGQYLPDRIISEDDFWHHQFWSNPGTQVLLKTDGYFPQHYTPGWQKGYAMRFTLGEHLLREMAGKARSKTAANMLAANHVFWIEVDRLYGIAVLER